MFVLALDSIVKKKRRGAIAFPVQTFQYKQVNHLRDCGEKTKLEEELTNRVRQLCEREVEEVMVLPLSCYLGIYSLIAMAIALRWTDGIGPVQ